MKGDTVTIAIPRDALTVVAPPPAFVDQKTVAQHVGLSSRTYLAWARAGVFPSQRHGRQVLARTDLVIAAVEATGHRDIKPDNVIEIASTKPTARERLAAVGVRKV